MTPLSILSKLLLLLPRLPGVCLALAALLLGLPAHTAPSEGTAGQTVTGRSLHRLDSSPARTAPFVAATPLQSKPAWNELSPTQRQALQPLAPHWDRLTEQHKLKWLALSKNYPTLSSEEQVKLHLRMSKWATLSQQQRAQARQNFKEIKNLTPEQKAAEWEAYQALSPEEKRQLAREARTQPAGVSTVKPGTTPKLAKVPRGAGSARPNMAEATLPVQHNTLLPRQESPARAVERSPYEDDPAE